MGKKIRFYLLFLMVLVCLTILAMAWDQYSWMRIKTDQMITFQRMVGGVGMGAISCPIWNFINFDPRIQPVDDSIIWPIPGGYSYGPDRTATVSYFEEIPVNQFFISPSPQLLRR
ncbi:MAG: hypothetical protein AB1502_04330 [Thermodesulfobacteriota bacterium]